MALAVRRRPAWRPPGAVLPGRSGLIRRRESNIADHTNSCNHHAGICYQSKEHDMNTTQTYGVEEIRMVVDYKIATNQAQRVWCVFNSMIIVNQGQSIVTIDQSLILNPGDALSIPGNSMEVTRQTFQVNFSGGGANNCLFIFKMYQK